MNYEFPQAVKDAIKENTDGGYFLFYFDEFGEPVFELDCDDVRTESAMINYIGPCISGLSEADKERRHTYGTFSKDSHGSEGHC